MTVSNQLRDSHSGKKMSTALYLAMDFKLLHDSWSWSVEAWAFLCWRKDMSNCSLAGSQKKMGYSRYED